MFQEIGGILVDAIGTGSLEFFVAIAAREKSDAQSACSARGQYVPDAVAHHTRGLDGVSQSLCRGKEKVWVGFRVSHLVARNDRNSIEIDAERLQHRPGCFHPATRRYRPRDPGLGQIAK